MAGRVEMARLARPVSTVGRDRPGSGMHGKFGVITEAKHGSSSIKWGNTIYQQQLLPQH